MLVGAACLGSPEKIQIIFCCFVMCYTVMVGGYKLVWDSMGDAMHSGGGIA